MKKVKQKRKRVISKINKIVGSSNLKRKGLSHVMIISK